MRSRALLVAVLVPALLAMAEGKPDCVGKAKKDGTCSTTTDQTGTDTVGGGATGKASELPTQTQKTDSETDAGGGGQPTGAPGKSAGGTTQNDAPDTSRRPQEDVDVLGEVVEREPPGQVDAEGSGSNGGAGGVGAPGGPATAGDSTATGAAAAETALAPPPAGIRYLTARLLGGADLEVLVNESRVRGIDGGWAVVVDVEGGSLVPEAVTATGHGGIPRMLLPSGPGQPVTLLAVSGQRSPESYDARYRAIGQLDLSARPVITITLIQ